MSRPVGLLREHAITIWAAAVKAVHPGRLIAQVLNDESIALRAKCAAARRIVVVGGGKAGASMAAAIEQALPEVVSKMTGLVNVPNESVQPLQSVLQAIRLHGVRPAGSNAPTAEGVDGAREMLEFVQQASPDDVVLCLISGGGSALLPLPADGITLEDKLRVTSLLHECGATINEMNTVRKHLSDIKGGGLARAFCGREMISLILSDVIGDPVDVIASGPTAADPTTFADGFGILNKYALVGRVPESVRECLQHGAAGRIPETLKESSANVHNFVIGNNAMALVSAHQCAAHFDYRVLNLGPYIEGETRDVASAFAGIVRSIQQDHIPIAPPACVLSGGETTVTLVPNHGLGGRNQEFVLATLVALGESGLRDTVILSGGTDGEDGPTDAAGACADTDTLRKASELGLDPVEYLHRNDAYTFFAATGDLFVTGLTGTNVMDVRVMLVG
jgi:glycerate 2-kinase